MPQLGADTLRHPLRSKFDDDDFYGARYLEDAVLLTAVTGAAVVGKRTYFAYLAGSDRNGAAVSGARVPLVNLLWQAARCCSTWSGSAKSEFPT